MGDLKLSVCSYRKKISPRKQSETAFALLYMCIIPLPVCAGDNPEAEGEGQLPAAAVPTKHSVSMSPKTSCHCVTLP